MNIKEIDAIQETLDRLASYSHTWLTDDVQTLNNFMKPLLEKWLQQEYRKERNLRYSWGQANPLVDIQICNSFLNSVETYCEEAMGEVTYADKETLDILHSMELEEHDDESLACLSQRLVEVRKERRRAKDYLRMSEPLFQFKKKHSAIIKELGKVSATTIQIDQTLSNRVYKPRIKTALGVAFENVKEEGASE